MKAFAFVHFLVAVTVTCTSVVKAFVVNHELRRDGIAAVLRPGLQEEYNKHILRGAPFKPFPTDYVREAMDSSIDWRLKGAVTPAKDQGPFGYCGTFGRST